jgi:hypothetical protein
MNKTRSLAALALLLSSSVTSLALAQTLTPAQQARQQQLKAAQAAAKARAAAAGTATAAPTAAATTAPTTAPTPAATATPPKATATATTTAAPTASAAPKATASATPATSGSAAPAAAHPDTSAIALDIEALRKSRPERRHAEFVDLQSRWGGLLNDPRAADELKLHAQRFAYLQRIRALGAKDPTFVKGVDALITKEETRSSDALNALRSGAFPAAAAAAPAATPAVAAPAAGAVK